MMVANCHLWLIIFEDGGWLMMADMLNVWLIGFDHFWIMVDSGIHSSQSELYQTIVSKLTLFISFYDERWVNASTIVDHRRFEILFFSHLWVEP